MARPTRRRDSQKAQFQRRVPKDLLAKARGRVTVIGLPGADGGEDEPVTVTIGSVVKFSLRTTDKALAKARCAAAIGHLEKLYSSLRGEPKELTHKQIVALSGEIYRLFVERFEDNPGTPSAWAAVKAFSRAACEGRLLTVPALLPDAVLDEEVAAAALFGTGLTAGINALPADASKSAEALEARFGWLADWVITKHALMISSACRANLLKQVATAAIDAAWQLKRNAGGDYSPDPKAARFPPVELGPPPTAQPTVSFTELFERWQRVSQPKPSTVKRWKRPVTVSFPAFLRKRIGHEDAGKVQKVDVAAWRDALITANISRKTIGDVNLAALNAVYSRAVRDGILTTNPVEGVDAGNAVKKAKQQGQARERGFTDAEAASLLKAALAFQPPRKMTKAAANLRRWVPWIAAYTGARVGEIVQLRAEDVFERCGTWYFRFTPEAGTIKAGGMREVPVHADLIRRGLIEFVRGQAAGPMFYRAERPGVPSLSRISNASTKLGTWVRTIVADPRVQPSHGWRHRFVTIARSVGMPEEQRNYLVGHAQPGMGASYGDMKGLPEAMALIPSVDLA